MEVPAETVSRGAGRDGERGADPRVEHGGDREGERGVAVEEASVAAGERCAGEEASAAPAEPTRRMILPCRLG